MKNIISVSNSDDSINTGKTLGVPKLEEFPIPIQNGTNLQNVFTCENNHAYSIQKMKSTNSSSLK